MVQEYSLLSEDDTEDEKCPQRSRLLSLPKWQAVAILAALITSITVNIFIGAHILWSSNNATQGRTSYGKYMQPKDSTRLLTNSSIAGLAQNVLMFWNRTTPYEGTDVETDRLWQDITIDHGIIALSDEYAESKGLPKARRFPWDHSKGLYILQGYHQLHCLVSQFSLSLSLSLSIDLTLIYLKKLLRTSVMEMHRDQTQTVPFGHLVHCLSLLRDDVMCHADDNPDGEAFALEPMKEPRYRQCKNWTQLESWAMDHTACYSLRDSSYEDAGSLERFKYCPKGSPYVEEVNKAFGEGANVDY